MLLVTNRDLHKDQTTLLLYLLLHRNSSVASFILSRTDIDNLVRAIFLYLWASPNFICKCHTLVKLSWRSILKVPTTKSRTQNKFVSMVPYTSGARSLFYSTKLRSYKEHCSFSCMVKSILGFPPPPWYVVCTHICFLVERHSQSQVFCPTTQWNDSSYW